MLAGRSSGPSSSGKAAYAGRSSGSRAACLYLARTAAAVANVCDKSLSVRTHVCTDCGLILDRDENAARNIQSAGQAVRGLAAVSRGDEPRTRRPLARAECL